MPAPNVTQYTPDELEKGKDFLTRWDPTKIQAAYLRGDIDLRTKADMLQAHGKITRELQVRQYSGESKLGALGGEVKNYAVGVAQESEKAWGAAKDYKGKEAAFRALMTGLQALSLYDIPGNTLERWLLQAGSDPSYARAANWALWIPTQFVGLTSLLRAPFKIAGKTINTGKDFVQYLKDPVGSAIKQSMAIDATKVITTAAGPVSIKLGKETAETATREGLEGFIPQLTPDEVHKKTINSLIEHYQQQSASFVRKGISHEQTAKEVGQINLAELMARPPEKGMSAAELGHLAEVNDKIRMGLEKALDEALPHLDDIGARPDLLGNFKAHLEAFAQTNPKFLGASGEVGRGLEYMKVLQPEVQTARVFDNVLKGLGAEKLINGTDEAMAEAMKKMSLMTPGTREILLNQATEAKNPGIFHSAYKTLLFLNPGTHVVNLTGTFAHGLANSIEFTGAALSPLKDAGAPTVREALAHWGGLSSALGNLPRIMRQAVERSSKNLGKYDLGGASDKLARYGTGRLLAMEDEIIGGIWESAFVQSKIMREGMEAGLKPGSAAMVKYFDDVVKDPNRIAQLVEEVSGSVDRVAMRQELGWTKGLADWIRQSPVDFIMPVVRFPINALKAGRDWTPGLQAFSTKLWADIAEGGTKEAAVRSRLALSWMTAQAVWAGAKAGVITGGGPQNYEANKIWQEAGNVPYSINGVSYNWAEPFRMPIGFVADMAHLQNEGDPDKVEDAVAAATLSFFRSIENNYFLRIMEGVTSVVSDVANVSKWQDIAYGLTKVAGAPFKTLIQGGPVGRRIEEQMNPEAEDYAFYGELKDIWTYTTAGTPWAADARPKLDLDANPVITPPVLGHRWASFLLPPIRTKNGPTSRAAELLDKWGVTVDDNWKSGPGQADPDDPLMGPSDASFRPNLSGDEAYNYKVLGLKHARRYNGKNWLESLEELENDPAFHGSTQQKKQQRVNRIFNQFQHEGFKMLQEADPIVKGKAEKAKELTRMRRGQSVPSADIMEESTTEEMPVQFMPPVDPAPAAPTAPQQ